MPTNSGASLFKSMDDAVVRRRGSLWGQETLQPIATQPKGMSFVCHQGWWVRQIWCRCVLRRGDLSILSHVQSRPAPLGQWAKGGGLQARFTPQRAHRLQGGLPVDAQKSAPVETQLVGIVYLGGARSLFRASGDHGRGPTPGYPGQQNEEQSTQQQAHKHR